MSISLYLPDDNTTAVCIFIRRWYSNKPVIAVSLAFNCHDERAEVFYAASAPGADPVLTLDASQVTAGLYFLKVLEERSTAARSFVRI